MAQKLGDWCSWECMLVSVILWVREGWVVGKGSRLWLCWLGRGPDGSGWDVGCCFSIKGRINCLGGVGESKGVGLLSLVSMLADKSVMALDMSAITSRKGCVQPRDMYHGTIWCLGEIRGGVGVCCHVV